MAPRARGLPLNTDTTLVVLAGGRSSRMGRPKSDLPVAGGTLLEWIVRRLGPHFAETLVCGATAPAGARGVADRVAGAGPLAGIDAGLAAMRTERAFVLACDMPRASASLARLLLDSARGHDAAVPLVGGMAHPTCAVYERRVGGRLAAALAAGHRRLGDVVASLDTAFVGPAELARAGISTDELIDLDTPADYEVFITSLGGASPKSS